MASFKALCLAGVASLVATAASAADLLPPAPAPVYAPPAPAVLGGGWYLRGDVGVGISDLRRDNSSFNPRSQVEGFNIDSSFLDDAAFIDGGVGYRFNQYFRADVTGEYRASAHYNATESATCHFSNCTSPRYEDAYNGSISSAVGLVNGYIDLGTWYAVTPFVGAGVGVARIGLNNLTDSGFGASSGGYGLARSNYTTNFAFAFMAGLDFAVTQNLTVEFGYRYLNEGKFASSTIRCQDSMPPCANEIQHFRLASNDIRLGFRYTFADLAPIGPSLPLIRKY